MSFGYRAYRRLPHGFRWFASIALASIALCGCGGGSSSATGGVSANAGGGQAPPPDNSPPPSNPALPTITILQPSPSGIATSSNALIAISGNASSDVTLVTWSNDRGGSGNAVGTTQWAASNVTLSEGANTITVTAHTAAGSRTASIIIDYLTSVSAGRTWYVDDDSTYSGADVGTAEDRPFPTLQAALEVARAGDTVLVKPGEYTDPQATWYSAFSPRNSGTALAPITIRSETPRAAVLVARHLVDEPPASSEEYPAMAIFTSSHIVVDGFQAKGQMKIQHGGVDPQAGIPNLPQYVTIQNCEVLYGSKEGTDASLNYGIMIHSSNYNTLRNNRVHQMRDSGNNSNNTAVIMAFASAHNLIENNDADAGNGVVYSAYGQKAGQIHDNVWRRNIARNAVVGFLGKGGTNGASYSDNETFYENVIINSQIAFNLNHNSRYWKVYNNTAYKVDFFMNQWQLNSVGNQYWNNLVVLAPQSEPPPQPETPPATRPQGFYRIEDGTTDWSAHISYSDHNFINTGASVFARSALTYSLDQWRQAVGDDLNSRSGDPQFDDLAGFTLRATSPARSAGRNGEDMGAYPTGTGTVGPTW